MQPSQTSPATRVRPASLQLAAVKHSLGLAVALSLLIFALDIYLPFTAAVHVAYVLPVYLISRSARAWHTYLVIAVATVLLCVAMFSAHAAASLLWAHFAVTQLAMLCASRRISAEARDATSFADMDQARTSLAHMTERVRNAAEATGLWISEWDVNGYTLWDMNRPKFFGESASHEELRKSALQALGRKSYESLRRQQLQAIAAREPNAACRYSLTLASGMVRHHEQRLRFVYDEAGRHLRTLSVVWDVTNEVQTLQMMQRQAEQERALFERLSIATQAGGIFPFEFNFATNKTAWDEPLPPVPGLEGLSAEVFSIKFAELIHPDDLLVLRARTQAGAIGARSDTESCSFRVPLPDGSIRYFKIHDRLIRDTAGGPISTLGICRETTKEVLASQRLQEQATQLREIQGRLDRAAFSSQEGHWELDIPNKKVWASSGLATLLGYDADTLAPDQILKAVHPDDSKVSRGAYQRYMEAFATGEARAPCDMQIRVRTAAGEWRWFQSRGQVAQCDEGGAPILMAGSLHDIHERKLAEASLHLIQQRFERAIRGTQDGIWEIDLTGDQLATWLSPRALELLGYDSDEKFGSNLLGDVHQEDVEALRKAYEDHIAGGGPVDVQVRLRTKQAEHRWFHLRGSAEFDEQHIAKRISGSMQDITEARLAHDALVQATEDARAANRAKSTFLANVSHEIRTPMNGIIGMTGLLLETELDRIQLEYAETIRGSADSLLTVINDILDFSKIEAGKLDVERIEMDLRANVEDVGAMMAFQAAAKDLELIVNVSPELPDRVMGDPQRIRQCLINLIGNAIKFTQSGEIVVEVLALARQDGRVITHFEVRDTGIGIAPEITKTLFQPFVQADSSTTRHFGGTGLGLSIVRRLSEMMDGQVGVQSVVGKGSIFWFSLPLDIPAETTSTLRVLRANPIGKRVLIVDDNATNRRVLVSQLEHVGYEVTSVSSGDEALAEMLRAQQSDRAYDVILTDFQMPEMDGAMLVERLNAHSELANSRIVMLTSMARYGDMTRFSALGLAGYLSKPVRARELFKCLDRVLAHESREWRVQSQPVVTRNVLEEHRAAQRYRGNVLLVEDNSVNQKVAQRFLERLGCTVTIANNGEQGVKTYLAGTFDIVLMDLQMPVMDGFTATRRIRDAEGWRARTPIIALTANAMTGQMERCLAAGMDGYLTKPLDVARLRDTLEEFGLADDDEIMDDAVAEQLVSTLTVIPAIDLAQLEAVTQGDEEFKRELIHAFIQSGEQVLAELDAAVRTQDRDRMGRAAHKLKGAAANMYAEAVRKACAELEEHAAQWTDAELQQHLQRLSSDVQHAMGALRDLLATDVRARSVS